ncbi:hypothetical protein HK097_009279 [Rhizophlyctis rosea]|uniref:PH domain-containing protein n=1 Tax=Rhizophlyctis rosea TaxID=64517 RepID=A0AAD5SLR7_9FUNG|nr:hypothetical protein HK097_009279 [Rhizophlyctis rosea]
MFGHKKEVPSPPGDEVPPPNTPGYELSDPLAAQRNDSTLSRNGSLSQRADSTLPRHGTVTSSTGATAVPSRSSTISTEAPVRKSDDSFHRAGRSSTVNSSGTAVSATSSAGNVYGDPADILLDRAAGWLSFIKNLMVSAANDSFCLASLVAGMVFTLPMRSQYHFDDLTETEKRIAASSGKASKYWQAPSKDRDLAFAQGGSSIQTLIKTLQEQSHSIATEHETITKTLSAQTLPTLHALAKEITKKMDGLEDEQRARKKERAKEEEKLRALQGHLKQGLLAARGNAPGHAKKASDPWLINIAVQQEMAHAHRKFSTRSKTLLDSERSFGIWESHVISQLRNALLAYTSLTAVQNHHPQIHQLHQAINAINPDQEWPAYRDARLPPDLLDPQSVRGFEEFMASRPYEGMNDELIQIVKEGPLQRKSKVLKKWREAWFVVTQAGWFHEFEKRPVFNGQEEIEPRKSIWLRECTLSPLQMPGARGEEFYLKKKEEPGMFGGGKSKYYKFSANSLPESQNWHEILQPFAGATLTINRPGGTISTNKGEAVTSPISPFTPDAANANHSTAPAAEQPQQQYNQDSLGRRFSVESRASTAHSLSDHEEGRGSFENGFRDGQKAVAFQEGPMVTAPHKA